MTMNGSLPPSSSTAFLMRARPRARDVAAGALAAGQRHGGDARVGDHALRPDAGIDEQRLEDARREARRARKISSIASAHCGTFDACLSRPTLPAISAGAAKRKTCQKGKFQGMTASTAPSGS